MKVVVQDKDNLFRAVIDLEKVKQQEISETEIKEKAAAVFGPVSGRIVSSLINNLNSMIQK